MSKYIGFSETEKAKFIAQGGTKVSSKLIFTSETEDNDVTLFDAVNIDWKGYKIGDTELSYSGDIISYITNSYSYILDNMVTSTDLPDFIGEDTKIRTQLSLYKTSNNQTSETPPFVDDNNASSLTYFNNGSASNNYWALSKNNSHGDGEYVWMSSYYATFKLNNEFIGWEGPSSDPILLKGEKGDTGKPADYYEIRYGLFSVSGPSSQEMPNITNPGDVDSKWYLVPQVNNDENLYTWSTQCHVVCVLNNNIIEQHYDGEWSEPIRITGKNGVSQPIQPVLRYYWHTTNDYSNSPSCTITNENPNINDVSWLESPGNPHDSYIYLWMIQGQRQNNVAQIIEGTSYWTSPICLSGADGEPGKDGDDIEFIYKRFENAHSFTTDNPSSWYTTASINKSVEEWIGSGKNNTYSYVNNYLGPVSDGWFDNPQGVDSTYKYEYATYRKTHKKNGESYWEAFNTPFAWSIYGENGLDGDGVEYIYYVTATADSGSEPTPPAFDLNPSSFQKSEVYGGWHDDPQKLNPNNNQLYQWVSKRNYKTITNNNKSLISSSFTGNSYTIGDYTVNVGDKIWFPYSNPELWNWYVYDGTNAPQIVMIYKRTGSITNYGSMPVADINDATSYTVPNMNGWTESPENNAGDDTAYLWMTTNYYSSKKIENNKSIYHVTDDWQTPVCLTGESGKDGEDGTDIEFIYLRTNEDNAVLKLPSTTDNNDYQTNDWPFTENTAYTAASIDGVGVIYSTSSHTYSFINGINAPMQQTSLDAVHDTWTDNSLGVTHEYDYEYAAIRKKINGNWENFCNPFLWSKYGEDGIDGDGVEYIFYLSPNENEVTFGDVSSISNNPASWDPSPNPEYVHDDYKYPTHNPGWSDEPQGVSIHNKYEYVSIRHKRLNPDSNKMEWGKYSEPALWARYAEDGRAISLVLESNNDMTSISINSNHIVNNLVETDTTFSLYHNTSLVDLSSTSYYKMEIFDSNGNDYVTGWDAQNSYSYLKYNNNILARLKPNSLNSNSYEMHISIPEGFDMTNIDDELRIYSKATILDPSFDINGDVQAGTEKLITTKVKGLQLSLDDIFQIWTDRAVLKNDGEGNYPILTYLQSLTSNTKITTAAEQNENKLFIIADNNNGYKDFVKVGLIEFKNVENSYTFKLYYNESGEPNMSNPGTFLDEETVTLVTESEIYQLVIDPQVINFSNVGENDIINCNVIMYTGNVVTNITNSLNDHNLTIKYRHVPVTGTPGNYTVLSNGSSISITSLNINISETKGIEFALFKNDVLISSSTVVLTKNGADPLLPLTCELLNDNWQIAVSKNKLSVLPGNRQTSFLSIYYGTTNIVNSISNLEITAIDAPTFWIEGQTINIETPPYSEDNVMIDFNVANAIALSSALESQQNITLQLSFNYQQNHYYKYINLSYNALAQDGENAELYELFIEDDIVKQYVLDDLINYNPNSLSVKIRHIYGGTTEIINPQAVSSTYKIYYTVDNSTWKATTTGSISIPQVEFEKITIALFNETPNANYTNYIDIETVKVVRDGINGTDSFAEEFIYYCPEGKTEIDWNNISDTTLDPSTWSRSTSPDHIENDAWKDHPTGIDEQHQYEYIAHRTWDKENEIWSNYTSPLIWSMWGVQGKDGDGVEYIYYRNNSETFDGPFPSNWTNDEDFQTTEYISSMSDDYYSYCNENFTISFSENSGFAYLFIPNGMKRYDDVTTPAASKIYSNITNIQYRESINGGDWSEWMDYDKDNETCDNDVYTTHPDATSVSEALYTEWVNENDNCSIVKDKNYHNDPFKTEGVGIAVSTGSSTSPTTIYKAIYFKRWIYKYTNKSNLRLQIRCLFNDSANARFACGSLFGQHSFFMFNDNNHITLSGNIKSLFNVASFSDVFTNEWPSATTFHITRLFGNYNINAFTVTSLGYTINLSYNGNTASITQTRIPQTANNNAIYDTKNLVLSPQEIYQGDYSQLFHKCINLVEGPIIAAKTIGIRACESMFNLCDAITTIVMYVNTVKDTNAFNYCVPTNEGNPTRTIIHYGTYDFSSIPVSPNVLRIRDWNIEKPSQWTDEPSGVSETNKYEWVSTRKYKEVTEDDTELINTGLDVGDKAWHPYSDPTIWSKYGEDGAPGEPGAPGASPITLDFTNNQVNFAVDDTGKIKDASQEKTSILNILNLPDNVTITNVTYSIDYFTESEAIIPSDDSSGQVSIAEYGDKSKFKINVSSNLNYITFTFKCGVWNSDIMKRYRYATDLIIPDSGLQVPFTVILSNNTQFTKVLNICGQHIAQDGQDGQNAITYEINPSANNVKISGTTYTPTTLSYTLIKYDGSNISQVSSWPTGLSTRWMNISSGAPIASNSSISSPQYKDLQEINLELLSGSTVIDREAIPIVRDGNDGQDGEQGSQGFTGPIIRYCGEWNDTSYYCGGKTNNNYDGVSPIYKDIVLHNGKYYTPYHLSWYYWNNETWASGVAGTAYINKGHSPSATNASEYWVEATQFDFVATKLLYADQALINQISSHDFIATTQDGTPVAGMTSGKKDYGNNDGSLSLLNNANNGNITNSGSSDSPTSGNDYYEDKSHVRIFAGKIWNDNNSYSLTYAPFNVRQDGTTYMSNAIVEGDITANTLKLGPDSFWNVTSNNESKTLPGLDNGQTFQYIVLTNSYVGSYVIAGNTNDSFRISVGGSATEGNITIDGSRYKKLTLRPNKLYQFISVDHQWNATEITLKIPDSLVEHYDCKNDVEIYAQTIYTDNDSIDYTSYYMKNQNQGFWARQIITDPVQRIENGVTITHHKAEFTFFTYLYNNERTEEGVNISLGDIMYWEQL